MVNLVRFLPQITMVNLVRFYFDTDEECRTGCFDGKPIEDVDADKADDFEQYLIDQNIGYIRIDL